MKVFSLLPLLLSAQAAAPTEEDLGNLFTRFKGQYKKSYMEAEEASRFSIFKENMAKSRELNMKHGYDCVDMFGKCGFGVTPFSDMSKTEFKRQMLGYTPGNRTRPLRALPPSEYAKAWDVQKKDWRADGKVTPIKNQNPCGVCWAFSATGTVESAYAIGTGGSPPLLSPEQLVDCDGTHSCDGKNSGGNYEQAWQYLESSGGLSLLSDYPITCCDGTSDPQIGSCKTGGDDVKVSGIYDGPFQDEDALAAAVASKGPFSIAVAAETWQNWQSGPYVLTGGCSGDVDHAVAIVGFDKTATDTSGNPLPYWIVRNQWGTDWGYDGYILIKMGENLCQLTTEPAIAEVEASKAKDVIV